MMENHPEQYSLICSVVTSSYTDIRAKYSLNRYMYILHSISILSTSSHVLYSISFIIKLLYLLSHYIPKLHFAREWVVKSMLYNRKRNLLSQTEQTSPFIVESFWWILARGGIEPQRLFSTSPKTISSLDWGLVKRNNHQLPFSPAPPHLAFFQVVCIKRFWIRAFKYENPRNRISYKLTYSLGFTWWCVSLARVFLSLLILIILSQR